MFLVVIQPFNYDNALYQSMALDLLQRGRIIYLGNLDHNFPGIIYFHCMCIALLGPSQMMFRLFDVSLQIFFVGFLYVFLQRWLTKHVSMLAALLYAVYYEACGWSAYGQRDIYAAMLIVIGISFLFSDKRGAFRLSLCGFLLGCSVLFKPTFLPLIFVMAFFVIVRDRFRLDAFLDRRSMLEGGLVIIFGMIPAVVLLCYYASVPGGLQAFYTATVLFNLDVYGPLSLPKLSPIMEFGRSIFLILFSGYAIFLLRDKRMVRKPEWLLCGTIVFLVLMQVFIQHKFFRYHLAAFFILLVPLAAMGIDRFAQRIPKQNMRSAFIATSIFLCTFIAYNPKTLFAFCSAVVHGSNAWQAADESRYSSTVLGVTAREATLNFFAKPGNESGSIEVCAPEPYLRLALFPRSTVGICANFTPLAFYKGMDRPHSVPAYEPYQREWQNAYMDSLRSKKPDFIVIGREVTMWNLKDIYTDFLHYVPGFDSLLNTSYRYDTAIGGFQIYRRSSIP